MTPFLSKWHLVNEVPAVLGQNLRINQGAHQVPVPHPSPDRGNRYSICQTHDCVTVPEGMRMCPLVVDPGKFAGLLDQPVRVVPLKIENSISIFEIVLLYPEPQLAGKIPGDRDGPDIFFLPLQCLYLDDPVLGIEVSDPGIQGLGDPDTGVPEENAKEPCLVIFSLQLGRNDLPDFITGKILRGLL